MIDNEEVTVSATFERYLIEMDKICERTPKMRYARVLMEYLIMTGHTRQHNAVCCREGWQRESVVTGQHATCRPLSASVLGVARHGIVRGWKEE
mmetsp:Transcript_15840/g.36389  ORF Transcript_15840/g.36389 Transcript_15840/m.36389 type:complete len:94 (-) Transcript_15840:876-1157(-)